MIHGFLAALAGAFTVASAFGEERLIERYEVRVHGGRGILVVERVEYEARCGMNPKEHLKVGGPDPDFMRAYVGPAPIKPPMLHPPTYKAEKFRLLYRGEQIGELPGDRFHDAKFGFTRVLPYVVRKVIAVGDGTLVISVESVVAADATISNRFPVVRNPDRIYIARRQRDRTWALAETVVNAPKSPETGEEMGEGQE